MQFALQLRPVAQFASGGGSDEFDLRTVQFRYFSSLIGVCLQRKVGSAVIYNPKSVMDFGGLNFKGLEYME